MKMRKRLLAYLMTCTCICAAVPAGMIAAQTVKSTGSHRIYVATYGSDSNSGTADAPFATIQKARDYVRSLNMTADVEVIIKEGTYYLEDQISLTPEDSGRNGFQVVYKGEEGKTVRVVGGKKVTGWNDSDGDGVYEADVTGNNDFWALYDNGQAVTVAQESNWQNKDFNDSRVQRVCSGGWFGEILRVASAQGGSLTFPEGVTESRWANEFLYLQGAKEFIDQPGEWALEGNTLYYKPVSGTVEGREIIMPTVNKIFDIQGEGPEESKRVSNISIENLTMEMTDFGPNFFAHSGHPSPYGGDGYASRESEENLVGIVTIDQANDISVKNCIIQNGGYVGVSSENYGQNITIEGNKMCNFGYTAIFLMGGLPGDERYHNKNNIITNNKISDIGGEDIPQASGIYLINSGDNKITHNDISGSNRYGISLKGVRYGAFAENGLPSVSFDEHFAYNHTRNNYIGYNRIRNCGANSADGGGIESWGMGRDNTIDHNIIINSYTGEPFSGWRGHSIFMDDGSCYVTVTNNITYDDKAPAVNAGLMTKSVGSTFDNNVFCIDYAGDGFANIQQFLEPAGDMTITRNIVVNYKGGEIGGDGSHNAGGTGPVDMFSISNSTILNYIKNMDRNIYYSASGRANYKMGSVTQNFEQWQQNEKGFDANSCEADPKFRDGANYDFRLQADSPAFTMGISPIDSSRIGLTKEYQFAEKSDQLDKIFVSGADGEQVFVIADTGDTVQLKVSGRTVNGYFVDQLDSVSYESNNSGIAAVDGSGGTVTVKGEGTAEITVTGTENGVSKTAVFTILSGNYVPSSIEIDNVEIGKQETKSLSPILKLEDGTTYPNADFTYESKDTSVVEVDAEGVLTGIASGTAEVTVSAELQGQTVEKTITVTVVNNTIRSLFDKVYAKDADKLTGNLNVNEDTGIVENAKAGDSLLFENVDFGARGAKQITIFTSSANTADEAGPIEVRIGSETGELVGTIEIPDGAGWDQYREVTADIDSQKTAGVKNVCLVFRGSSNIDWIRMTEGDMPPRDLFQKTLASAYDEQSGIELEGDGANLAWIDQGDYVVFKNVVLGDKKAKRIAASVSSDKKTVNDIGNIEVRLDSKDGELIAEIPGLVTNGWGNYQISVAAVNEKAVGNRDVYFVFRGNEGKASMNVQWFQFSDEAVSTNPETIEITGPKTVTIHTDEDTGYSYQAKALDSWGMEIETDMIRWKLDKEYAGIQIDDITGQLTVKKDAVPAGQIQIIAIFTTTMKEQVYPVRVNGESTSELPCVEKLMLRLSADQDVTAGSDNRVSAWGPVSQSDSSKQPLYVENAYNGGDAIRFEGGIQYLSGNTGVDFNDREQMTIVAVGTRAESSEKEDGYGEMTAPFRFQENGGWGGMYLNWNQDSVKYRFGTGTTECQTIYTGSDAPDNHSLASLMVIKDGAQEDLYINGNKTKSTTGKTSRTKNISPDMTVGNENGDFTGDLCEILIFDCALTEDEVALVQQYIQKKYFDKQESSITIKNSLEKVYDGNPVADPEYDLVGTGAVTVEYKLKDAADSTYTSDKPTDAGDYTLRVSVAADGFYQAASATQDFSISQKELNVVNVTIKNKQYDGECSAEIATAELDGVVPGDAVSLINGIPTFTAADEADNVPVKFTEFTIVGEDAANYKLRQPENVAADIYNKYTAEAGRDYTVSSEGWTNRDFTVTAREGYQLSLTNTLNGQWSDTLTESDETDNGNLQFYVRNTKTKAISKAAAVTYMIDKTAPVINVEENKGETCEKLTFTVTEKNLMSVTVNGKEIQADADGNYVVKGNNENPDVLITAVDKAGNETTCSAKVYGEHAFTENAPNNDATEEENASETAMRDYGSGTVYTGETPATGDDTNGTVWLIAIIMSGAAAACGMIRYKRKRQNKTRA